MYQLIAMTRHGPLTARFHDLQSLQVLALAWESESFLIMSKSRIVYAQGV